MVKKNIKLLFILLLFSWMLVWSLFFVPWFLTFLSANPTFPIWQAYLLHESIYVVSMVLISFIIVGKISSSLRLGLAVFLLYQALIIAMPPLCISLQGELLTTTQNMSCLAGTDTFTSTWFSIFGIHGSSLYYFTYIGGFIIYVALAIVLLTKRELFEELKRGLI
jgi:hypothetical protein